MTWHPECPFERDVLDLVIVGRSPVDTDGNLADHVAQCAVCSDAARAGLAVQALNDESLTLAPVPDAGVIWYRARLRARDEAVRTVARPLLVMEATGVVLLAALAAAAAWWAIDRSWMETMTAWLDRARQIPDVSWSWPADVLTAARWGAVGLGTSVAVACLAFYVAGLADRESSPGQDRRSSAV